MHMTCGHYEIQPNVVQALLSPHGFQSSHSGRVAGLAARSLLLSRAKPLFTLSPASDNEHHTELGESLFRMPVLQILEKTLLL